MKTEKRIKKENLHLANIEIAELNKVKILVVEFADLLKQLESGSIGEFELKVNEKTNFTNPMVSASAFGLESEYKRLLELEKLIDNRLNIEDLNSSKELKSTLIANIKEKHIEYYSSEDLKLKNTLEKIMQQYNSLPMAERQNIGFNRSYELAFTLMSNLIR